MFSRLITVFALLVAGAAIVPIISESVPPRSVKAQTPSAKARSVRPGDHEVLARIEGPTQSDPGDLIVLDATSSSNADVFKWTLATGSKSFLPVDGGTKVVFASGAPGDYKFILSAAGVHEGKADLSVAVHVVKIGAPAPPPAPPGPTPNPPPGPSPAPPVAGRRIAVLLHQSGSQTTAVGDVIRDLRQGPAEKYLADNKHSLFIADEDNAAYSAWKAAAGALPRPVLMVADPVSNRMLHKDTLGTLTADGVIELIKRNGG